MQASDYSIPSGLSFSGAWLPMPASVLLLAFDHAPVPQLLPKIRAAIEGIFADGTENSHSAGPVYLADSLHWVIVVSHKLPLSKAQVQAELVRQGGRLIAYLRSNHHLECTIGVSNPCYDSSQLQTYVEQCQVALHGRMYDGPGRVYLYQYQCFIRIHEGYYLDDFETALFSGDPFDRALLQEKLSVFFDLLRVNRPGLEDLRNELFQFVVLIYTYCFRHNVSFSSIFGLKYPEPAMLDHYSTLDQLQDSFNACLSTLEELTAAPSSHHRQEIQKITEYIQRNYAQDITLQSVSEYVGISPNYICKLYKNETGVNFKDYISLVRIAQAKRLLLSTNLGIGEIAEQVGFHNASYFCRVFKENVGVTALQFRIQPTPTEP